MSCGIGGLKTQTVLLNTVFYNSKTVLRNSLLGNSTINTIMSYETLCPATMSHQGKYITEHLVPKLAQHVTE